MRLREDWRESHEPHETGEAYETWTDENQYADDPNEGDEVPESENSKEGDAALEKYEGGEACLGALATGSTLRALVEDMNSKETLVTILWCGTMSQNIAGGVSFSVCSDQSEKVSARLH